MNIIYISTVFPRENESSTIYTDLAEALVEYGHKVTVVAAEEKKESAGTRLVKERGCNVLRVKTGNIYDVNIFEKGVSILLLERQLKSAIRKYLRNREFDLILFEAPPVTLSGVVQMSKKLYKAPAFLMMKDIFPQNAVDIGLMKKGSFIHRFFRMKEKELYRVADNIGCMSEGNRSYIAEHIRNCRFLQTRKRYMMYHQKFYLYGTNTVYLETKLYLYLVEIWENHREWSSWPTPLENLRV